MTAKVTDPSTEFASELDDSPYAAPERTGVVPRVTPATPATTNNAALVVPRLLYVVASYAVFITLILAQLGYTMVLGVESSFGISRDSLLDDWSHVVGLGAPLLLRAVSSALDALLDPHFYRTVLQVHGWMFVALLIAVLLWLRFRRPSRAVSLSNDTRSLLIGIAVVVVGSIGVMPTLLAATVVLGLPAVATPMLGLKAAQNYWYEVVVKPASCLPVRSRAERLSPRGAFTPQAAVCVAVSKDGKERYQGRVVLSGSNYVVLYDPGTGVTRKVDTEGAVIEAVAALD